MSLDICRAENTAHPQHLQTNINSTCYEYLSHVIDRLRAAGRGAYFICKTAGEGQYTPPGFQPRTVTGLDGKPYTCTGVSHDALWCDGKQYDTAARANDSGSPIFNPDGSPMTAEPVWNEIPPEHWRPNNPPLKYGAAPPQSIPPPTPSFPYPDEPTTIKVYQDRVKATYAAAGRQFPDPNDSDAFRWFTRYAYDCRVMPEPESANKHIAELRQALGLSPV